MVCELPEKRGMRPNMAQTRVNVSCDTASRRRWRNGCGCTFNHFPKFRCSVSLRVSSHMVDVPGKRTSHTTIADSKYLVRLVTAVSGRSQPIVSPMQHQLILLYNLRSMDPKAKKCSVARVLLSEEQYNRWTLVFPFLPRIGSQHSNHPMPRVACATH